MIRHQPSGHREITSAGRSRKVTMPVRSLRAITQSCPCTVTLTNVSRHPRLGGDDGAHGWRAFPCARSVGAALRLPDGGGVAACYDGELVRIAPDGTRVVPAPWPGVSFARLAATADGRAWAATLGGSVVPADADAPGFDVGEPIVALLPMPQGWLLTQTASGAIRIFDPSDGTELLALPATSRDIRVDRQGRVQMVRGHALETWSIPDAPRRRFVRGAHGIADVAWQADGTRALAADGGGNLLVVNPTRSPPIAVVPWIDEVAKAVAPRPGGDALIVGAFRFGVARVDLAGPLPTVDPFSPEPHGARRMVATSTGGALLAIFAPGIYELDPQGAVVARHAADHTFADLDVDPRGRSAVAAGDTLFVWRDGITSTAPLPFAASLVSISGQGRIAIAARQRIAILDDQHAVELEWAVPRALLELEFVGDALIAGGFLDGRVRVWRIRDGTLVAELPGHAERVAAIAVSPDGTTLVSGGWDGALRFADLRVVRAPRSEVAGLIAGWGSDVSAPAPSSPPRAPPP